MLNQSEIKAYLARLGITGIEAPTKEYLFELHRAHVTAIPWQTLDIFAGRPASMDIKESIALMLTQRSGYCFQLNGAFSTLLRALGYEVAWHRAGVQPAGQEPRINSFHLGVTVKLSSEQGIEEDWIVDVGLGDMPYEPIPLRFGTYEQGHMTYRLTSSGVADGGWRLEHDPRASFIGVDVAPEEEADLRLFFPKHEFYSRSSESPWINTFLMRQRSEAETNEIRGCVWKRWHRAGVDTTELTNKSDWLELLAEVFNERFVRYSSIERDEIWRKVLHQHEEWKSSAIS